MAEGNTPHVKIVIFGPVKSRRLKTSLGLNIIPAKTCSLNCLYCELGPTLKTSVTGHPYIKEERVLAELKKFLEKKRKIDFLTFSGCGEPTLNTRLGEIIAAIKKTTAIPVAVITNATLLSSPRARRALAQADVLLPSLDAAREETFRRINRPHRSLTASGVIKGLTALRREFAGLIFLEIMLLKGVNDSPAELAAIKKAILKIKPDRVQLNTVVREPADPRAKALSRQELLKIKKSLGPNCQIVAGPKDKRKKLLKRLAEND